MRPVFVRLLSPNVGSDAGTRLRRTPARQEETVASLAQLAVNSKYDILVTVEHQERILASARLETTIP